MSCKQYMKNKPIKWAFKWWCQCFSKTGYLYEFDLYLGKKEKSITWAWGDSRFGFVKKVRKHTLHSVF